MPKNPGIHQVLVLEPDRLCAAVLARTVGHVFPDAEVHCESEPGRAAVALAEQSIDLFIVALRGFDLDVVTLLSVWAEHDIERTHVLVVTPDVHSTAVVAAQTLPISGIFDSTSGDMVELETACRAVAAGGLYFSATVTLTDAPSLSLPGERPARAALVARSARLPGRGAPPNQAFRARTKRPHGRR